MKSKLMLKYSAFVTQLLVVVLFLCALYAIYTVLFLNKRHNNGLDVVVASSRDMTMSVLGSEENHINSSGTALYLNR